MNRLPPDWKIIEGDATESPSEAPKEFVEIMKRLQKAPPKVASGGKSSAIDMSFVARDASGEEIRIEYSDLEYGAMLIPHTENGVQGIQVACAGNTSNVVSLGVTMLNFLQLRGLLTQVLAIYGAGGGLNGPPNDPDDRPEWLH